MKKKKTIVICGFSKKLRNGKPNPKNYHYWDKVIEVLKSTYHLIQIGLEGDEDLKCHEFKKNLPLKEIRSLVEKSDTWISVETFLFHFARLLNKPGVVIWHVCNPDIFGYKENTNLFKDKKLFRPNQFDYFEETPYNSATHVSPTQVVTAVKRLLN
jgi:ADP-heptose:LPS heptosyltransferase